MWASDRIEKLVPYLRRYARAATGDTKIGDAAVERSLEELLQLSLQPDFDFDLYAGALAHSGRRISEHSCLPRSACAAR